MYTTHGMSRGATRETTSSRRGKEMLIFEDKENSHPNRATRSTDVEIEQDVEVSSDCRADCPAGHRLVAECSLQPPRLFWNFSSYQELVKGAFPGPPTESTSVVAGKAPAPPGSGFAGIGLVVCKDQNKDTRVVGVFTEGAAAKNGKIMIGDILTAVNGVAMTDLQGNESLSRLTKDLNGGLSLTFARMHPGKPRELFDVKFNEDDLREHGRDRKGVLKHHTFKAASFRQVRNKKDRACVIMGKTLTMHKNADFESDIKHTIALTSCKLRTNPKQPLSFALEVPAPDSKPDGTPGKASSNKTSKSTLHVFIAKSEADYNIWMVTIASIQKREQEKSNIVKNVLGLEGKDAEAALLKIT